MSILFRSRLLLVAAILLLAVGASACKSICLPQFNEAWVGSDYSSSSVAIFEPTNTWIDNSKVAASLLKFIEEEGVGSLVKRHGFECVPKPGGDCPDCLACTLNRRGIIGYYCEPDGDLFVKAEIGPGKTMRAQTYWRG